MGRYGRDGEPESAYTPRLFLSLIENFGEGTAFTASRLQVPEMRSWTTLHDLLTAQHNMEMTHFLINIDKGDRKKFEYIKSPMAQYFERQQKEAQTRRGRTVLFTDLDLDDLDILPEHLKG